MKNKLFSIMISLFLCVTLAFSSATVALADDYSIPVSNAGLFKSIEPYTAFGKNNGTLNSAIAYGLTYKGTKYNTVTDSITKIRMVDEYYCVALGSYFSTGKYKGYGIGSKFVIYTSTNKSFKVIWTDQKADKDTDSQNLIMNSDKSVVEFVSDKWENVPEKVKNAGSYHVLEQFSGYITRVVPIEKVTSGDGSSSTNNNYVAENATQTKSFSSTSNISYRLASNETTNEGLDSLNSLNINNMASLSFVEKSTKQSSQSLKEAIDNIIVYNPNTEEILDDKVYGDASLLTTGYLGNPVKPPYTYSCSSLYYSSGAYHGGNDIACSTGTSVYAMDGGVVVNSCDVKDAYGNYTSYGRYVKIRHTTVNGTYYTLYAHLSQRKVEVGQIVEKGEIIGLSGNTGNSSGPHLHIELQPSGTNKGWDNLNPADFIGKNISYAGFKNH